MHLFNQNLNCVWTGMLKSAIWFIRHDKKQQDIKVYNNSLNNNLKNSACI